MSTHRISIDIDEDEHKYLKMCCARLGVTIKQFVIKCTLESVDAWEDRWMLERWARDGTDKEFENSRNDINRTVYEVIFDNDNVVYEEKTYGEIRDSLNGL